MALGGGGLRPFSIPFSKGEYPCPPRPTSSGPPRSRSLLAIGERTVWRMLARGQLPQPVRLSRKLVRFRTAEIEAHVRRQAAGEAAHG